jgi:hypothetical protein
VPDRSDGMKFYEEINIKYLVDRPDPLATSFSEYHYEVKHLPTGSIFQRSMWCWSRLDALDLVNHWNRFAKWKYRLLEG